MANSYLRLTLTESAVNIGNNTSVVSVNVVVQMQNGYSGYSGYATSVSISCDGQGATINVPSYNIAANGSMNLGTVSFTIGHNTDGSKSVGASATWYANNSYVGTPSGSASKTLTTIPRATTPTLAYADSAKRMGTNLTIGLPAASSAFTHNVSYKFGNTSGAVASGIKTSTVWTIPKTLAVQIPNSAIANGSIIVDTFNGSSKIGTKEVSFTAAVSDEMVPTFTSITASRVDNGVPTTFGIYIQGYSKVILTINGAAGSNGSTVKSYSITGNGYSSNKQTDTFGALKNVGTMTFTGTIIDSRGKTASKTVAITVYEYNPPTLTFTAERCTSSGTVSLDGTYLLIKPVYSFASVNGKNYIASKSFSCGSYTNTTCASGSNCIIGSGAIAVNQQYDVTGKVTDAIGNTATILMHVGTSAVPFNIKSNGKGIGFGKYAETDHILESTWMIKMNGRILIDWIVPVGTVLINSEVGFNPNVYYPGTTWQRIKGRVIVGVDENDESFKDGVSGGHKEMQTHSHTGTVASGGGHRHKIYMNATGSPSEIVPMWQILPPPGFGQTSTAGQTKLYAVSTWDGAHTHSLTTNNAGTGGAGNLPPYITKYVWERTA